MNRSSQREWRRKRFGVSHLGEASGLSKEFQLTWLCVDADAFVVFVHWIALGQLNTRDTPQTMATTRHATMRIFIRN